MRKFFALALWTAALFAVASTAGAFAQDSTALLTTDDESALIQAIEKPGDAPEDIHTKNLACKRLAVIGTDAAIPALSALLADEKQNFNARYALEAIPSAAVDAALAKAANELDGACLIGVVDSIGVRDKAESVELLTKLYESKTDAGVRKAIFAALGALATDDACGFLVSESKKADFANAELLLKRGLGDAILDVAEKRENAGNLVGAAALYDSATADVFPTFVREAGTYRALLCRGADSADKIVELLGSERGAIVDLALKTIREFDAENGPKVVEKLLASFDSFPEDLQVRVVRALGDRKDDASKKLVFPKLIDLAKTDSIPLKIAVAKALVGAGTIDEIASIGALDDLKNFDDAELSAAIVALAVSFDDEKFVAEYDDSVSKNLENSVLKALTENESLVVLKIVELRRVEAAGPALVKIAETKTGAVRDAALAALSEIVSLDNLDLLVEALNGETDDAKVDWILRAACTRMPREECAAKVAEIFAKSDVAGKIKILPLLKQIGGQTALSCVANACNDAATVDKATQILGEWNTPDDAQNLANVCLTIAKQSRDAKYASRGIRGYVRVARQFDMPVAQKIEMCKTAFETAKRADDKALIFEVFKRNVSAENVVAALEYAQYDEFKEAACEAAVFVAEKIRVSQPDWNWNAASDNEAQTKAGKDLIAAMQKVVATTANAELKARAQKLL